MTIPSISPAPISKTLLQRILSAQSYYVFLFGLLPCFTLVFGSIVLDFGFYTASATAFAPINREVGYLSAPNWSVAYAVLFPAMLYLMTETLQGIADALDSLHINGMVRNSGMQTIHEKQLTNSWITGTSVRSRLLLIFGAIVPIVYSLAEWVPNNLLRLLGSGPDAQYSDYDWGLAGIIHQPLQPVSSLLYRLGNASFDLLAFSTEGLLIAASFVFFLLLLDLGRVLPGGRDRSLILVPNLRSDDHRRGFEVFARPLQKTLGVALITYLILYCVRLEGVYMKSQDAPSLGAFVQSDIWSGVAEAADPGQGKVLPADAAKRSARVSVLQHLFSTGDQTARGILAWFVSVLLFTCSLIVVVMTVQEAASRARSTLSKPDANDMVVWPLGYLKLSTILLLMFLATCTLYLYRIGLFVSGFVVAVLLIKLVYGIIKPSSPQNDQQVSVDTPKEH